MKTSAQVMMQPIPHTGKRHILGGVLPATTFRHC